MDQEITIERLQFSDKLELMDFSAPVWKDKSVSAKFVQAWYDAFKNNEHRLFIYGIRKDGKLVCVSISYDTLHDLPSLGWLRGVFRIASLSIVSLFIFILCLCDWIKVLFTQEAKKHLLFKEILSSRYLAIALIETLSSHQNQGLEHRMLHYLCQKAKEEGFKGVFCTIVDKESPLFRACLEEGFKEIPKEEMFPRERWFWKIQIHEILFKVLFKFKEEDEYGTSWCCMLLVF